MDDQQQKKKYTTMDHDDDPNHHDHDTTTTNTATATTSTANSMDTKQMIVSIMAHPYDDMYDHRSISIQNQYTIHSRFVSIHPKAMNHLSNTNETYYHQSSSS